MSACEYASQYHFWGSCWGGLNTAFNEVCIDLNGWEEREEREKIGDSQQEEREKREAIGDSQQEEREKREAIGDSQQEEREKKRETIGDSQHEGREELNEPLKRKREAMDERCENEERKKRLQTKLTIENYSDNKSKLESALQKYDPIILEINGIFAYLSNIIYNTFKYIFPFELDI